MLKEQTIPEATHASAQARHATRQAAGYHTATPEARNAAEANGGGKGAVLGTPNPF